MLQDFASDEEVGEVQGLGGSEVNEGWRPLVSVMPDMRAASSHSVITSKVRYLGDLTRSSMERNTSESWPCFALRTGMSLFRLQLQRGSLQCTDRPFGLFDEAVGNGHKFLFSRLI